MKNQASLVDVDRLVVAFFAPGRPITKGNMVKNKWGVIYDKTKGLDHWTKTIRGCARAHMRGVPFEGPVHVRLSFYFERPKGHYTSTGALSAVGRRASKPIAKNKNDIDKLSRTVLDALVGKDPIVLLDDSQVIRLSAEKEWDMMEGAFITVESLWT